MHFPWSSRLFSSPADLKNIAYSIFPTIGAQRKNIKYKI
jgi:hypothetical protein